MRREAKSLFSNYMLLNIIYIIEQWARGKIFSPIQQFSNSAIHRFSNSAIQQFSNSPISNSQPPIHKFPHSSQLKAHSSKLKAHSSKLKAHSSKLKAHSSKLIAQSSS